MRLALNERWAGEGVLDDQPSLSARPEAAVVWKGNLVHRLASILVASGLALLVCAAGAPTAHATVLGFTGALTVAFGPNGGSPYFSDVVIGAGTADVTYAGADIDAISGLSAGSFVFAGPTFPITDPLAFPVTSIRLDATSDIGDFTALTTGGGGTMALRGAFTAGLFGGTSMLTLQTDDGGTQGIGLGGFFVTGATGIEFVLQANGWTTGSVTNGFGTYSGFVAGNSVRLVSQFQYEPFNPSINSFPGVAILDLTFVPEPGTAVLLASGMMLLGGRARAARRGSSATPRN